MIAKEAKKRREAAEAFEQGGRAESAARELAEGEILDAYLPKQLSDDELAAHRRAAPSRRRRPPGPRGRARWAPS